MLTTVADGIWVHQSPVLQNNSVVIQGRDGVLVVDPGITRDEMACLAGDIRGLGQTVVAGFATHPHWDHVLWIDELGDAPRHGTVACAEALREQMSDPDWRTKEAEDLPPEIADDVPMDLYGLITALPSGADRVPWDGPEVQIIEHSAHERGHASLLVDRVLVAGDMLSDILMPFPSPAAADPLGDYRAGLQMLEDVADQVDRVVPGHGSVGSDVRARIELDRAYVDALQGGTRPDDPRIGPDTTYGQDWVPGIYEWHRAQFGPAS
ncbi:MBL fold metallo-hydrolase [Aeromicrobium panaciterrae]|uniref:MBL fold metallo-hydrolase n=1 Tax=Aeromicrobium panaciterrae TaxID=363861 RepID=UPI0031E34E84